MQNEYHNCVVCGAETRFDKDYYTKITPACDGCWELGSRIQRQPKLARRFLEAVEAGEEYTTVRFDPADA